jgi:hypothetical protein
VVAGLLVLLAVPVPVFAQQAEGTITTNSETINRRQCDGTTADVANLQPPLTLEMRWTVKLDTDVTQFPTNGTYTVYAASRESVAGKTVNDIVGVSCTTARDGEAYTPGILVEGIRAESQSSLTRSFSMSQVVTRAGLTCANDGATVYLCVQLLDGATEVGWATATVRLDVTAPTTAPTDVTLRAGDSTLYVDCVGGNSDIDSFKAKATAAGQPDRFSNRASSCGDLVIENLVNEQTYTVVVYGMDDAGNASVPSAAVTGAPVPTDGFWEHYANEGGQEQGGCSSHGAQVWLAALPLLLLVLLRRRRS